MRQKLRERLRTDGNWKSGSMFLIICLKSGEPFIHGNDRTEESKNLFGVEDERGPKVVQKLLAAAADGGGFVEYYDGGPKKAYAVENTSGITARRFVLVGGYSQDVSHVINTDRGSSEARRHRTASQVVDRETLITFVEEACTLKPSRLKATAASPGSEAPSGRKEGTGNQAPSTCSS